MKEKKKRWLIVLPIVVSMVVFISFFIPKETLPSSDTRVILEHTYKTYIAPLCFEESNATNNLDESTLQKAQDLNYRPHSSCTENALKGEKERLFTSLLKEIGIIDKKWDNW